MNRIEKVLMITVYAVGLLGALLLSLSTADFSQFLMMLVACVGAYVYVDYYRFFSLPRMLGNIIALLVVLYPFIDFLDKTNPDQLLTIARLLIHLQIVLMFERKNPRLIWQLFVLSLLEVVVASALKMELVSGFVLFLYIIFTFASLVLMLVHRDADRLVEQGKQLTKSNALWTRRRTRDRQGPLRRTEAFFDQVEPNGSTASKLIQKASAMVTMAAIFAMFLFYSIPRLNDTWQGAESTEGDTVGFSDSVSFDEDGLIQQGNEPVMRVTILDRDGNPVELANGLYLRGATLESYARREGTMRWNARPFGRGGMNIVSVEVPRGKEPEYIQQVVLEPSKSNILFSAAGAYRTAGTPNRIRVDTLRHTLYREGESNNRGERNTAPAVRYTFELGLSCVSGRYESPTYPFRRTERDAARGPMTRDELNRLTVITIDPHYVETLPTIVERAMKAREAYSDSERRLICQALEQSLRNDSSFQYTLDFTDVIRDPKLDPLEDFVKNHKQGHCEYYAGALCLMLRSQGIPARLVNGYHGGDFNTLGKFFEVKQRHAHTWVEAYLRPSDCTPEMIERGEADRNGAWLRLDPTPGRGSDPSAQDQNIAKSADEVFDYMKVLWDDFVVGLDAKRQNRTQLNGGASSFLSSSFWESKIHEALGSVPALQDNPWLVAQASVIVTVILFALYFALNRVRAKSRSSGRKVRVVLHELIAKVSPSVAKWLLPTNIANEESTVDFYLKLVSVLKANGFERSNTQTPQEWIESVTSSRGSEQPEFRQSLATLVRLFYQVRFGQIPLSENDSTSVKNAIELIEQSLKEQSATSYSPT